MSRIITRLDPDLPVCWEDSDTLRVGFERADARVPSPSAGVQRVIGALRAGVPAEELPREARRLGATPQEMRDLLAALGPVLRSEVESQGSPAAEPAPAAATSASVSGRTVSLAVSDDGRAVTGLRDALLATGVCGIDEGPQAAAPDLVVHVERYLEPLEWAQRWLTTGQPHLLLGFTDRAIRVGPLIGSEGAPCHTCSTLAALDRDPALAVVAAQLAGSRPHSESPAGTHMAAAWIAVFIRNWTAGDPGVHTSRATVPCTRGRVSGAVTLDTVDPHPECACAATSSRSRPRR